MALQRENAPYLELNINGKKINNTTVHTMKFTAKRNDIYHLQILTILNATVDEYLIAEIPECNMDGLIIDKSVSFNVKQIKEIESTSISKQLGWALILKLCVFIITLLTRNFLSYLSYLALS